VLSSPTVGGDEVYWVSDEGMGSCADARTGEILWQKRVGGRTCASPLCAAGRIYFFAQDGKTTVQVQVQVQVSLLTIDTSGACG
jgi:outer membrane protein assembly factor BamB